MANKLNVFGFKDSDGALQQPLVDSSNRVVTQTYDSFNNRSLNVSADALVIAKSASHAPLKIRVHVLAATSTAGFIHDAATIGAAADSNRLAAIPATVGATIDIPVAVSSGIVFKVGSGLVVSIYWLE
jgi:hypothetical protein